MDVHLLSECLGYVEVCNISVHNVTGIVMLVLGVRQACDIRDNDDYVVG